MKSKSAFVKTFPTVMVLTLIVSLTLWIGFGKSVWGLSYALGSVTSLWAMSMLSKSSNRILSEDEKGAKKTAAIGYVIRYVVYALVLVVAQLSDQFEILAVAVGLLSFKLVLYILLFTERQGDSK